MATKTTARQRTKAAPARKKRAPSAGIKKIAAVNRDTMKEAILKHLLFSQGRTPELATINDWYMALAYSVRDLLMERWSQTMKRYSEEKKIKVVSYLSAEFLMGPHLGNALINLGIEEVTKKAVDEFKRSYDITLDTLLEQETEPGLGNGGLGRLAACFMDSMTTMDIPAFGYGIRYEFGIFDQEIKDGWQVERTDKWLALGNPWEIVRPEISYDVKIGGHTEHFMDHNNKLRANWIPHRVLKGIAYDTPIPGYHGHMINHLRLWSAQAVESFDFEAFNVGNYYKAVDEKVTSETLSKVLYPNDEPESGKRLRLAQQYFFVSCSLQDMLRIHGLRKLPIDRFPESFAVQLNDTHPAIAISEMMRILVDEELMDWDKAWELTRATFAYTNHTLLPEALEKWPVMYLQQMLPRNLEIIYEINRRLLEETRGRFPTDDWMTERVSLIDETPPKFVRMANLATAGSHAINGVAALHSQLLQKTVLADFYKLYPDRFFNVTNGVTPRRWMVLSNPRLAELISSAIGEDWITDAAELRKLERFADDTSFKEKWMTVKYDNKERLAELIESKTGLEVDPDSLFDIQVKRFHEYKRQHLNILHVITLYNRLKRKAVKSIAPRTVIFGGKAAPGYYMAKLIIKLINAVADVVNNDHETWDKLKIVFFPDFNVKTGQRIYPAAELSEQISTAGKEASGTGNMKFTMNGALTIGTLDGANVEIREEVGSENFFLFGLPVEEVTKLRSGGYRPWEFIESNAELKEALEQIRSGYFSYGNQEIFAPLVNALWSHDEYLLCADYASYIECQDSVNAAYADNKKWTKMSILNTAGSGSFSSDRSIREYAEKIWNVKPLY